jgi:hypothetical protein
MGNNPFLERFIARAMALPHPRVLELGTRQSVEGRSTMHKEWIPTAGSWIGVDFEPGADVDVIADVHRLSQIVGAESADCIIHCSLMEHIRYPQLAAHEIMKTLKVGGLMFCQTHFAWPLHGFPQDFHRFTREALESLFPPGMGMQCESMYEFPCSICSEREPATSLGTAYLNSCIWGTKVARTPDQWVYDLPKMR